MVLNEDDASDLVVDMHVESSTCGGFVFPRAVLHHRFLLRPADSSLSLLPIVRGSTHLLSRAVLYEVIVFCLMVCTLALIDLIPSSIRDRSFFADYIAPYIVIPLDRAFCFVILLVVHSSIR